MAQSKQDLLNDLLREAYELEFGDGKKNAFIARARMIIKKVFGEFSSYDDAVKLIRFSPRITHAGMGQNAYKSSFEHGKKSLIETLNVMIEDLQLSSNFETEVSAKAEIAAAESPSKKIFIVHGHNNEMKETVARFVGKIEYEPIILHEQASQGKTIIEKFDAHSNVPLAIVLLSADDIGTTKDGDLSKGKLRARQNVIFELGYFLAKLGRDNVIVLHETSSDFEFPSDYQGVLYIPFDQSGHWKFSIIKEMKAVGFEVDANQAL